MLHFSKVEDAREKISIAELLLIISASVISFIIFNAFILDTLRLTINSWIVLVMSSMESCALLLTLLRRREIDKVNLPELLGFLVIVAFTILYMIYPSLPALVPPSHHFDAVHPIALSDFIFEQNTLPHDYTGGTFPFYPPGYPVGGAVTVAVIAHWLNRVPIDTLHPTISLVLGLSAGLLFLMLRTIISDHPFADPISFLATCLLFTAWEYFPGSVNERYFFGQTFAQFFALITFYYLNAYIRKPDFFFLFLIFLSLATVLFSHPSPLVAPAVGIAIVLLWQLRNDPARVLMHTALLALGFGLIVFFYVLPRWSAWVGQTGYGEAVALSTESIGFVLPILGIIGLFVGSRKPWRKKTLIVLLLFAAILIQPLSLSVAKFFIPNIGSYYFDKSVYLLIYPLAMFAGVAIVRLDTFVNSRGPIRSVKAAWLMSLTLALSIVVLFPPRPFAPITASEIQVAKWAQSHLDSKNLGVVSPVREDDYWVRVAILHENPSSELATQAYNLGSMEYQEWRQNPGKPDYALVRNLARIPIDPAVQTLYQYGQSGILLKPQEKGPDSFSPQHRMLLKFGDLFELIGYDVTDPAAPGSPFTISFYWQPLRWPPNRITMFVQVVDSLGNVPTRLERDILLASSPTQHWPIGVVVTDSWKLNLDQAVLPGQYEIEIAMFDKLTGTRLQIDPGTPQIEQTRLDPFRVAIPAPSIDEVAAAQKLNALFENKIFLRGYTLSPISVTPGDSIHLTIYWESKARLEDDYTIFVHLLDLAGNVVAQIDSPPQNGTHRTNIWQPNEIIKDPYHLLVPKYLPLGNYQIEVGLYNSNTMKRLTVGTDDHIIIATTLTSK